MTCEVEACEVEACEVEACEAEEGGRLEAGSTPRIPFPVPWPAGCGGISVLAGSDLAISDLAISDLAISDLAISDLAISDLLFSVFATIAFDVSCASGRAGGMALAMDVTGCAGPAEASFICPALTWTVFTLTGFIGSKEPGIAAIGWVCMTPLVSGAGSALA